MYAQMNTQSQARAAREAREYVCALTPHALALAECVIAGEEAQ